MLSKFFIILALLIEPKSMKRLININFLAKTLAQIQFIPKEQSRIFQKQIQTTMSLIEIINPGVFYDMDIYHQQPISTICIIYF